jgi:hypothetical protein
MAYSDLRVFQGFAWSSSDDTNDEDYDDTEQAALEPQPTFVTPPPSPHTTQPIHSSLPIPTDAVVIILDNNDDEDDTEPAALELQPAFEAPLPSPHTTQPIHSSLRIPTDAVVIILDDDDDDDAAALEAQSTFISPPTSPSSSQQMDDNEHDEEVAQLTFFAPPSPSPLPPISIRRSPRLAFLAHVSYVGMC